MQSLYSFFVWLSWHFIKAIIFNNFSCPLPVHKHGSVKLLPHPLSPHIRGHPLTPHKGSKVKYSNFAITKAIVNIFCWNFECRQSCNRYETLAWRPGSEPLGWTKIYTFSEDGHVAYQIKADDACSNMVANIFSQTHPRPRGWGQKVKPYLFLKAWTWTCISN